MPTLVVILIISFLILIHEAGHFFAARKAGIKVEEFGIGYPPTLFKLFTWQGTDFTLNAIPFGGFVRLLGEHGPEAAEAADEARQKEKKKQQDQEEKAADKLPFYKQSAKNRMMVILAGVVVNIVFALIAFSVVFSFMGIPKPLTGQARIGWISEGSPAEEANLPANVNLIEVKTDENSYQIGSITDAQQAVRENTGNTLTLVVTEQCERLTCPSKTQVFEVYARTEEEIPETQEPQGSLGIVFKDSILAHYPWYQMPFRGTAYGIRQALALGWLILVTLARIFSQLFTQGIIEEEVAGPVGLVHEARQGNLFENNFLSYLGFAGMLSLNLGIMNLLPIPALDGGRALFIFLEKVIGKKTAQKIEPYANYAGIALIILLIIAVTAKDITRVFGG